MSYIDQLEVEIIASGEDPAFAGAASDDVISDFENALGVKFPHLTYCFLKNMERYPLPATRTTVLQKTV